MQKLYRKFFRKYEVKLDRIWIQRIDEMPLPAGWLSKLWQHIGLQKPHWPSTPKPSEMLNTPPVSLFQWQRLQPGTLKWRYGSKTIILYIFSHVVTLIFGLQIFRNSKDCPNKVFDWITFLPVISKWTCGTKTAFMSIFDHVVTLTFDPFDFKFSKNA